MKNPIYTKGLVKDEKGREFFFDNAKFILIFLVVLAHLFGTLRSSDVTTVRVIATGIWNFCNTFHMATFIFISGYFARRFVKKGYSVQKPFSYFMIYLAAQTAFVLCEKFWWADSPADITWTIFKAQGSLWFLQCMVIWYLLIPMLDQIKPKYIIGGALILALIVGYDIRVNDYLSFSRVIVHLPFFMAGYYINPSFIDKIKKKGFIAFSWLFVAGVFVAETLMGKSLPGNLLRCNTPYKNCGLQLPKYLWWAGRLEFYIVVFALIFTFLAIVPRCKTFFSKFGSRTLAVYLLHRFIFRSFEVYNWGRFFDKSLLGVAELFVFVAVVVIVLSLKPFSVPFDLLQKISIKKYLKDK